MARVWNNRGFTLIELIIVLVIAGILAILVLSRFLTRTDFDAAGLYDGTLAILRYAQKSAVAQRRQVCVGFSAGAVSLRIASTFGTACDRDLAGPDGAAPYTLALPAGISYATMPTDFNFSPAGAPSVGQTIAVTGVAGKTIAIDAVSGHVYAN